MRVRSVIYYYSIFNERLRDFHANLCVGIEKKQNQRFQRKSEKLVKFLKIFQKNSSTDGREHEFTENFESEMRVKDRFPSNFLTIFFSKKTKMSRTRQKY